MEARTGTKRFTLTGLQRPAVINSKTKQRVVILRDVSISMNDDNKAVDASRATEGFLSELAQPGNKDGFLVSVVDYSDAAGCID